MLTLFLILFSSANIIKGTEDLNVVVVVASSTQRTEIDDLIAQLSNASSKSKSEKTKISSGVLRSLLEQTRNHISLGVFETKEKKTIKKRVSNVWKTFHLILSKENGRTVPNVNWCTLCSEVVFNPAHDGGTNYLHRHKCHKSQ